MYQHEPDGRISVYRLGYSESKRYYSSLEEPCDCPDSKAKKKQCCHEYICNPVFIASKWGQIYHRRDCLTQSILIGDYQNPVFKKTAGNIFFLSSGVIGTVEEFHPASSLGEGLIDNNYKPEPR